MHKLIEVLADLSKAVTFGSIKIGQRFIANQWGDKQDHEFVKRDDKTATSSDVFDANGGEHHKRGWTGRTQFSKRDPVIPVDKT